MQSEHPKKIGNIDMANLISWRDNTLSKIKVNNPYHPLDQCSLPLVENQLTQDLFKNAKWGDRYHTKNGQRAIFIGVDDFEINHKQYSFSIEGCNIVHWFEPNGECQTNRDYDILPQCEGNVWGETKKEVI